MTGTSVHLSATTAEELRSVAQRLAGACVGGDVIVLTGDLGAGKTTFTQGLARGLGIEEHVTSPTFVISRVHPHPAEGLALVHVDAYRLGSFAELDDLDLEADLDRAVVAVEWGRGLAEGLSPEGLDIVLGRSDDESDEERTVSITARGGHWVTDLPEVMAP